MRVRVCIVCVCVKERERESKLGKGNCVIIMYNHRAQVWIGVVLLLFALLSCCMLLPFTVVTTTRMDKSTDTFEQVCVCVCARVYICKRTHTFSCLLSTEGTRAECSCTETRMHILYAL
jgi:hypothetical protein